MSDLQQEQSIIQSFFTKSCPGDWSGIEVFSQIQSFGEFYHRYRVIIPRVRFCK